MQQLSLGCQAAAEPHLPLGLYSLRWRGINWRMLANSVSVLAAATRI